MAKIAIKSDKITPFGGIFHVMDQFSSVLEPVIDEVLGRRSKLVGYQYGEIIRSLMCVYFWVHPRIALVLSCSPSSSSVKYSSSL